MNKKKFPWWIVLIAVVVMVISIIASSSSGSSNLENDLSLALPVEIRTYIWDGMAYNFIEDDRDFEEDGAGTQHVLNVKNLTVDRHSTEGKYDTADCTIVMEDEYIEKTIYVTLYSTQYDTGWVVESWEEIQEPTVVPKAEPDINYLKNALGFNNVTVTEDNLSLEQGKYTFSCMVNDFYNYLDVSGEIVLTAEFSQSYNYREDLCIYGWSYNSDVENSTLQFDWKVEGIWTLGVSEYDLSNKKGELIISNLSNNVEYSSMDYRHLGNYSGSARYFEKDAYWALGGYADENEYYDFSNNSGYFYIDGIDWLNNSFNPAEISLEIDGGYYITMEFTRDSVKAYLDGQECSYIYHS